MHRMLRIEWDAVAGVLAAVTAIVLHFLHSFILADIDRAPGGAGPGAPAVGIGAAPDSTRGQGEARGRAIEPDASGYGHRTASAGSCPKIEMMRQPSLVLTSE